jgi:2-amino-4-hydroxy-6-hydroxymethyldihydropteridine diphosphokinase
MPKIYISLGSNIEPERHLRNALGCMQHHFYDLRLSPVYENEAVGFEGTPFWNLVAECETTLGPEDVSRELKSIEDKNGRLRDGPKFSSRTLDLDLLLYDDLDLRDRGMDVPRNEITKYAFVLKPLVDLAPELVHPLLGKTMQQLWNAMEGEAQSMRVVDVELMQGEGE